MRPEILANLAAGLFILPFFFFSATSGQLADKYDRAMLARLTKLLEIGIMIVAIAGFLLHSLTLLLAALFLLDLQSDAVSSWSKYAILPQHLHEDELVGGNAQVEAGTFVAILIGTLTQAACLPGPGSMRCGSPWPALLSPSLSRQSRHPRKRRRGAGTVVNVNPLSETWRNIGFARENRTVFLSILGISWFWLYGAVLAQLPAYGKIVLGGGEGAVTLLLAVFVGIGVGSRYSASGFPRVMSNWGWCRWDRSA